MDKQLFILVAAAADKENLIEQIKDAIAMYDEAVLLNKDVEKAYQKVVFVAHMIMINHEAGGKISGAMNIVKRIEEIEKRDKLFDTSSVKN